MEPLVEWVPLPTVLETPGTEPSVESDPLLERLLLQRDLLTTEQRREFLSPDRSNLIDADRMTGLTAAVERLAAAAENGERVAIVGDYDVDGITSAALAAAVCGACGIETEVMIPHRLRDGYGLTPTFVERAQAAACKLILALDCGTNDLEAVQLATDRGLDVVVVDHHLPTVELPAGTVLVNPKQDGCSYPFKELCTAGLVFKLTSALGKRMSRSVPADSLLRVAALGTIADMVPLLDENRVIAAQGLAELADTPSPGLRALLSVAGVDRPVTAEDVAFRIAPRINAAGRMDDPRTAFDLLLCRDAKEGQRLALELDQRNQERRAVEQRVVAEALEEVSTQQPMPGILVASSDGWPRGVLGIAAGRLARQFHRPCILLSEEGETATGSGRSISAIHLHEFLTRWSDRYVRFGGHAQAMGISVPTAELESLRALWTAAAAEWSPDMLRKTVRYAAEFDSFAALDDTFRTVQRLEPFGMGNPEPILLWRNVEKTGARAFGTGHLEFRVRSVDGAKAELIGWRWQEKQELFDAPCDILGAVQWDSYKRRPTVRLIEARRTQATPSDGS